jgi:branched-subunit amino acid transport protein
MNSMATDTMGLRQGLDPFRSPAFRPPAPGLWSRVVAQGKAKGVLFLVFCLWVQLPYFLNQHFVFFPVTVMPATVLDNLVPFVPLATWPYLSLYPGAAAVPLLMVNGRRLLRCTLGFILIGLATHLVFFFWPTAIAVPAFGDVHFLYAFLRDVDGTLCACPSLHASQAVFFALWGNQLLRRAGRRGWRLALWAWCLVVLVSTLLTKQHVLADLAAGTALAAVVYFGVEWVHHLRTRGTPAFPGRCPGLKNATPSG